MKNCPQTLIAVKGQNDQDHLLAILKLFEIPARAIDEGERRLLGGQRFGVVIGTQEP